ncbi:MAG: type II toxin-antitoxin system RelB/DinJ family antitoxin [Nitrospira sp.]
MTVVRVRIDKHTKEEAAVGLAVMGLTVSEAFLCHRVHRAAAFFPSTAKLTSQVFWAPLKASLVPLVTMEMCYSYMMNFN